MIWIQGGVLDASPTQIGRSIIEQGGAWRMIFFMATLVIVMLLVAFVPWTATYIPHRFMRP